jgi:hypothetical protein
VISLALQPKAQKQDENHLVAILVHAAARHES